MGTFVAILLGTIVGGLVVAIEGSGPVLAGAVALAIAVAGLSREPDDPATAAPWIPGSRSTGTRSPRRGRTSRIAHGNRVVWLSMLGISWFWFYGAIFLAQFAGFARDVARRQRARRHAAARAVLDRHRRRLAALRAALGPRASSSASSRSARSGSPSSRSTCGSRAATCTRAASPGSTCSSRAPAHWRVAADLVLIGLFGGFYIVPLYALIQERSQPSHRSRIIAANNILNALFMVVSAGLAIALLAAGPHDPRALPRHGADERRGRALHLRARPRVPDALPRVAPHPHVLPGRQGGPREHPGRRAAASSSATT